LKKISLELLSVMRAMVRDIKKIDRLESMNHVPCVADLEKNEDEIPRSIHDRHDFKVITCQSTSAGDVEVKRGKYGKWMMPSISFARSVENELRTQSKNDIVMNARTMMRVIS